MNHRTQAVFSSIAIAVFLGLAPIACSTEIPVTDDSEPGVIPPALDAAHEAYLDSNWLALEERVRDVLLDTTASELAKDNALQLLDKAYDVTHGSLPATFVAPKGVSALGYGVTRISAPHWMSFRHHFRGKTPDASLIDDIVVWRLPSEDPILDRRGGKGEFKITHSDAGIDDFSLESGDEAAPPADGVFSVRLSFRDGTVWEAWFVADRLEASTVPELRSPLEDASVSGPHPRIEWEPFRSPEFRPFERKTVALWLSRAGADEWGWSYWNGDPQVPHAVVVGKEPNAKETDLIPGDYWLGLSLDEVKDFGPIRLARAARVAQPFHVVP